MADPNPGASGSGSESAAVEVRARTVDEAIARGLVRLGGLARSEVEIEILSEGKAGLLGFGSEEALVRLTPLGSDATPTMSGSGGGATGADQGEADEGASPARRRRRRRRRRTREEAEPSAEPVAAESPAESPAAPEPEPVAPELREERQETAPVIPVAEAPAPSPAAPPPPPATEGEVLEMAQEIVRDMLDKLGYEDVRVEAEGGLLPESLQEEDSSVLCVRGEGTGRLLARDGEPLRALQFLTRLMVSRRTDAWTNLLIDVDGDRRRQIKELIALAEQSAGLVENDGRPVSLPPMGAYERRVVHIALKDHPTIATQSIGSGDRRKVTVRRKDQLLPDM